MTVDGASPQAGALSPDGTARLLDQMFRLWIEPAIDERCLGLSRSDVTKALVVLPPSAPPQVLVNDAVQFVARVRATRRIEQGEAMTAADFDRIEDLAPAEVDPNAGWIALAKLGDEVVIAFDFRRNRQTAMVLVERADEFEDSARTSLSKGHLGPAIESGFAAMELAVKAEIYLIEDSPSKVHQKRVTWWSRWVELGNAPGESDAILERLYREREASRYADRPISMSVEDVMTALRHVHAVIEHARLSCAPKQLLP
jgi:HEPN domain-containing protein